MRKIISLFERNHHTDRLVRDEVVPGAEWVVAGEGVATRKLDGTCCMVSGGVLFKRYDVKNGKTPPAAFLPAQEPDPITGHWPGWVPVGDGPEDQWHREALAPLVMWDGTYELIGPKIQGNPEHWITHELIPHDAPWLVFEDAFAPPRDFEGLRRFLEPLQIEGIVWHHPDGRMVKIKRSDFFGKRRDQPQSMTSVLLVAKY